MISIRAFAFLAASACGAMPPTLAAQAESPPDSADKTFFTKRDAVYAATAVAASAVTSIFDERIASWTQSARVQGPPSRTDLAHSLTVVNETPLTIGAFALFGVGRLAGNATLADVGLHTTEALVITVGASELIRGPLGRSRPRVSEDDPFHFEVGAGFTNFAARSYPSIHAAVAFAAATALVGEIRERNPDAAKVAAPVLYTLALVPGFTRMYLNQHWASDVVAGTFLGALIGSKVVSYAHSHRRSRLDRVLLGTTIVPQAQGSVLVLHSVQY